MKPHEEEWIHEKGSTLVSCGPGDDDSGVFYGHGPTAEVRARLASAAPDMARALLAVLEHDKRFREAPEDANRSPIEAVTAALAKAGVPCP